MSYFGCVCEPLHLISIANELPRYLLLCQSVETLSLSLSLSIERERERGFSNARKRSLSLEELKGAGRRSSLWPKTTYSAPVKGYNLMQEAIQGG